MRKSLSISGRKRSAVSNVVVPAGSEIATSSMRKSSKITVCQPIKMQDPTSKQLLLAMPGSTVGLKNIKHLNSKRSVSSLESILSKPDVDYSQRPIFLTFVDSAIEIIFRSETKTLLNQKSQRFALIAAAIEVAHMIDFSDGMTVCHTSVPQIILGVNIGLCVSLCALAVTTWKKEETDNAWIPHRDSLAEKSADIGSELLVLLIISLHNVAVELMTQGFMGLQPAMILGNAVLLSPCLLPVRFIMAGAFQFIGFLAFVLTYVLDRSNSCGDTSSHGDHAGTGATYQFLALLIFSAIGILQAYTAERNQRVLWASEREKELLISVHTALAAGFHKLKNKHRNIKNMQNMEHDPLKEVMVELGILRDDLKATGNVTAGTMIENVMREFMGGSSGYGGKNAALLGSNDTTGGYLSLLQSRRGYDSRQSDQNKFDRGSPGKESLTSDSMSFQEIGNESSGSIKSATRRHTTAAVASFDPTRNAKRPAALPVQMHSLLTTYDELGVRMKDWHFGEAGVFEMPEGGKGHELMLTLHYTFVHYNVFHRLEVVPSTFHRFICTIEELYGGVSYHNRFHAADVVHSAFWMLSQAGIDAKENITMNTIFATLVGAAVHDVGHPGVGNTYLVNLGSEFALRFNDLHVLENMHLSIAFNVMRDEKMDIMAHMEPIDRREIRSFLIDGVIATDLSLHFEKVAKLKGMVESNSVDLSESSDASEIVCAVLHSADIACTAKRWPIYRKWIDHLFHEFLAQGDLEKVAGLVPAPMMDRVQSCPPQAQIGFINFIVTPLYQVVQQYAPSFKTAVDELAVNIEHLSIWETDFDKQYCLKLKLRDDLIPPGTTVIPGGGAAFDDRLLRAASGDQSPRRRGRRHTGGARQSDVGRGKRSRSLLSNRSRSVTNLTIED